LKILQQKLKKDIIAVLVEKIPNLYTQSDLNVHTDSNIPGPSGISAPCHDSSVVNVLSADSAPSIPSETKRTRLHGKRQSIKGKGKGEESCGICNKSYNDEEDWICCDNCGIWFHRGCVNLDDDLEWNMLIEEGQTFTCPMCI
jgi:hypothetical protein